jgi:predicted transcriptional regulator
MLTAAGLWDIVGSMTDIKKAINQSYLRGQVIALYKLKANMQDTINKLEDQIKEDEKEKEKVGS